MISAFLVSLDCMYCLISGTGSGWFTAWWGGGGGGGGGKWNSGWSAGAAHTPALSSAEPCMLNMAEWEAGTEGREEAVEMQLNWEVSFCLKNVPILGRDDTESIFFLCFFPLLWLMRAARPMLLSVTERQHAVQYAECLSSGNSVSQPIKSGRVNHDFWKEQLISAWMSHMSFNQKGTTTSMLNSSERKEIGGQ